MKHGYVREIYDFGWCKEIEEKHTGRYGAPGMRREKKRKATPEEMARQNQWRKERDVRRLIKANFNRNDYWITLTYRKENRPDPERLKKDIRAFLQRLRRKYRQYGQELKYILRLAIGKKGAPHVHILVNRLIDCETTTDIVIAEQWKHGHVYYKLTYQEGGYQQLAEYITKPLEAYEPETLKRYQTSKNLIRPVPKKKEIKRRNLVDKYGNPVEPKPPKGYELEEGSLISGINPITGYRYRHYTIVKKE